MTGGDTCGKKMQTNACRAIDESGKEGGSPAGQVGELSRANRGPKVVILEELERAQINLNVHGLIIVGVPNH